MKTLVLLILAASAAGCATLSAGQQSQGISGATVDATPTFSAPDEIAFPSQNENMGPQIIIPVTGGTPVMGIPLGGNIFQPVTGGPPVVGISTNP